MMTLCVMVRLTSALGFLLPAAVRHLNIKIDDNNVLMGRRVLHRRSAWRHSHSTFSSREEEREEGEDSSLETSIRNLIRIADNDDASSPLFDDADRVDSERRSEEEEELASLLSSSSSSSVFPNPLEDRTGVSSDPPPLPDSYFSSTPLHATTTTTREQMTLLHSLASRQRQQLQQQQQQTLHNNDNTTIIATTTNETTTKELQSLQMPHDDTTEQRRHAFKFRTKGDSFRQRRESILKRLEDELHNFTTQQQRQRLDDHYNLTDATCQHCGCILSADEITRSSSSPRVCRICHVEQILSQNAPNSDWNDFIRRNDERRNSTQTTHRPSSPFLVRRRPYHGRVFDTTTPPMTPNHPNNNKETNENHWNRNVSNDKKVVQHPRPWSSSSSSNTTTVNQQPVFQHYYETQMKLLQEDIVRLQNLIQSSDMTLNLLNERVQMLEEETTTHFITQQQLLHTRQKNQGRNQTFVSSSTTTNTNNNNDRQRQQWMKVMDPDTGDEFYWNEHTEEMQYNSPHPQ